MVPGATFVQVEGEMIRSEHVYHDRQIVAVQQGLKALDEGRVVSHEDVKSRVASWSHRGQK